MAKKKPKKGKWITVARGQILPGPDGLSTIIWFDPKGCKKKAR